MSFDFDRRDFDRRFKQQQDDFDRDFARAKKFGVAWLIIWVIVVLGLLCLGAWAVIELVQWVTAQ